MTAEKLAETLYRDDLGRASEVPVERDGHKAYAGWLKGAHAAGDSDTLAALQSVDEDDFARAWERLVQA